jgi:hypothetical protein
MDQAAIGTLVGVCCFLSVLLVGLGAYLLAREGFRREPAVRLGLRGFPLDPDEGSDFPWGEDGREPGRVISLPEGMRTTHQLVLGASEMGKTKALAGWVTHDLRAGHGVIVIDPHEELVDDALALAGDHLADPVILAAGDPEWAVGYNPLQPRGGMTPYQTAAALLDVFQKVWEGSWGVLMHDYLLHAFWALSAAGWTMLEVPRFLTDPGYRGALARQLTSLGDGRLQPLLDWIRLYDEKTPGQQRQEIQSTMVRVRQFVSDPNIRVIIGQRRNTFSFQDILASRTPFFAALTWRALKVNAYLLGALLLSQLQDAILSSPTLTRVPRPTTYFYVDEFQEMATPAFGEVLAQARKFGLSVVVSTQSLAPLGTELKAAVKTNCRNLAIFQCSHEDATALAHELFVEAMSQPVGVAELAFGRPFDPASSEYVARLKALRPRQFYARRKGETLALLMRSRTVRLPRDAPTLVAEARDRAGRRHGRRRGAVEAELEARQVALDRLSAGGTMAEEDSREGETGPAPDAVVDIPD